MWLLPLTNDSKCGLLDESDYMWANQYKWFAKQTGSMTYIARSVREGRHVITIYLHREILGLSNRRQEGHHKNGNTYDNRFINLEERTKRPHKRYQ